MTTRQTNTRGESDRPVWGAHGSRQALMGPLGLSLLVLAVTAVVILSGLATVGSAAFGRGTNTLQPAEEMERLVALHKESMKEWQDRFNGRSAFFKPPPPPIDTIYRGPSVAFAYGETVYFNPPSVNEKYLRINVGEEKAGIRVLSTADLPWSVRLGYRGGEYDVNIFAKGGESAFFVTAPRQQSPTSPFLVAVPGLSQPPSGGLLDGAGTSSISSPGSSLPSEVMPGRAEAAARRVSGEPDDDEVADDEEMDDEDFDDESDDEFDDDEDIDDDFDDVDDDDDTDVDDGGDGDPMDADDDEEPVDSDEEPESPEAR